MKNAIKVSLAIWLLVFSQVDLSAAIPANTVWEVRQPGSDVSSGGFVAGTGTPTVSAASDLTVDGTLNTKVTSATRGSFVSGDAFKWLTVSGSPVGSITIVGNGVGSCTSPTVAIAAGSGTTATATLTVAGGVVTGYTLTNSGGTDYTAPPALTFTSTGCSSPITGYATLLFNLGWYQILSISSGAAVLDHSPAVISSANGTFSFYPGVDYSQNNNKNATSCTNCGNATNNISTTDLTTTTTGGFTATSATAAFTADITGNCIYLAGGTGGTVTTSNCYVATYASATTITLDRSPGAVVTLATMNIGGALATVAGACAAQAAIGSNKIFVQYNATPYAPTATITCNQSVTPSNTVPLSKLIGYHTTRGDIAQACSAASPACPTIQATTNPNIDILAMTGNGWEVDNFILDCNSLTGSQSLHGTGSYVVFYNLKSTNCKSTSGAIQLSFLGLLAYSEVTSFNGGSGNPAINPGGASTITYNYIHDFTSGYGILFGTANVVFTGNVLSNITGHCIIVTNGNQQTITQNTGYACTDFAHLQDGLRASLYKNNVISNMTAWGSDATQSAFAANWMWDGNCYYSNASGNRHNLDDTTVNAVDGGSPYVNKFDVAATAQVLNNPGSGDFTLNNLAGGGAACRGAGSPLNLPGLTQTSAVDMGAFQHLAATAGAVGYPIQ